MHKKRYKEDMVFQVKDGIQCLPAPGSILIYREGEGGPEFDRRKAKAYMNKVTARIKEEILGVFKRWEKLE